MTDNMQNMNVRDELESAAAYVREEVEVMGSQLVERVKSLIQEGNVRRLTLRNSENEVIFEAPLTTGIAIGSGVVTALLAAVGAVAALMTNFKVEVEREKKSSKK